MALIRLSNLITTKSKVSHIIVLDLVVYDENKLTKTILSRGQNISKKTPRSCCSKVEEKITETVLTTDLTKYEYYQIV